MNLFFVHTPFQLLVAQSVIIENELSDNILALSNTGANAAHFYDSFSLIKIERLWESQYILGDLSKGVFKSRTPVSSFFNIKRFSSEVSEIIKGNVVKHLFFGDINHLAYLLLAKKFEQILEVNFFEEGFSHYNNNFIRKRYNNGATIFLKTIFVDIIIYSTFKVSGFSKYLYPTRDLPIDLLKFRKYSILKTQNESDTIKIDFKIHYSEKLSSYLSNYINSLKINPESKTLLYLSTSGSFLFHDPLGDEIKVLEKFTELHSFKDYVILVKFHPKDKKEKRVAFLNHFKKTTLQCYEVTEEVALPIEVLFTKIRIDAIAGYGSSAQLYGKILLPNASNYCLYPTLRLLYHQQNLPVDFPLKAWEQWNDVHFKYFKENSLF